MTLTITYDTAGDGRHIAEVVEVPGAMAYGDTREEAGRRALAVALRHIADLVQYDGLDLRELRVVDVGD